jgi:hypothetical protein
MLGCLGLGMSQISARAEWARGWNGSRLVLNLAAPDPMARDGARLRGDGLYWRRPMLQSRGNAIIRARHPTTRERAI